MLAEYDDKDLPSALLAELQFRTGRPPISENKQEMLKMAFGRGYGVSKAARHCGVHRNTATAYYAKFRADELLPRRKRSPASEERALRMPTFAWAAIGKHAARKGITGAELAAKILQAVVEDNLFAAVLDDDDITTPIAQQRDEP